MIKELSNKKLYLRIDNYNFLKGRYWLDTKSYENNQELYVNLLELERSVNPNQLKYNTRRIVKKSRSSGCYK